MKKSNSKKGRVFWITGYSGSGKTEIAKKINTCTGLSVSTV